jgi:hypothetical protein
MDDLNSAELQFLLIEYTHIRTAARAGVYRPLPAQTKLRLVKAGSPLRFPSRHLLRFAAHCGVRR